MGRVSRYRKVKACDPFYKGPRKDLNWSGNLRPMSEEQPVPKSVLQLMKSAERAKDGPQKKKKKKKGNRPVTEMQHTGRRTGTGGGIPSSAGETDAFQRRKGESLREYLERLDVESNARIMDCYKKGRRMSERRKRYLDERRRKLRAKKEGVEEEDLSKEDREGPVDFSDLRDDVRFGEVVSAPPRLSSVPRGSVPKGKKEKASSLLLRKKLSCTPLGSDTADLKLGLSRLKPRQKCGGLKRQHDLEEEREKAIQLYRRSKKVKHSPLTLQ